MYNEIILSRLDNLPYLKTLKGSNITATSKKNQYNDIVKFYARINSNDVVENISFKATGCTYFLVFCDYFCSLAEGKTIKNILKIDAEKMYTLMPLTDNRKHVIDIIFATFQLLAKKYKKGIEKGTITPIDVEEKPDENKDKSETKTKSTSSKKENTSRETTQKESSKKENNQKLLKEMSKNVSKEKKIEDAPKKSKSSTAKESNKVETKVESNDVKKETPAMKSAGKEKQEDNVKNLSSMLSRIKGNSKNSSSLSKESKADSEVETKENVKIEKNDTQKVEEKPQEQTQEKPQRKGLFAWLRKKDK